MVNLRAAWQFTRNLEVFVRGDRVFDQDPENFGLLGQRSDEVIDGLADDQPFLFDAGPPSAGRVGKLVRL